MPRAATAQIVPVTTDNTVLTKGTATELQAVDPLKQYLGKDACDHATLKREAKAIIVSTAQGHVEAGIRLRILKAEMEHGEFKTFAENELPCSYDHAKKLVGLVDRMILLDEKSGGKWSFEKTRQLDYKKVFAITRLADQHEDELRNEGTVDGMSIDDVKLLPRPDLEAKCRELQKEVEKKEKRITDGRKQLNDKQKELHSYKLADETAVQRACLRVQEGFLEVFNEFTNTARKHLPHEEALTKQDKIHLVLTIEHIHQISDTLITYIEENFEAGGKLSAKDMRESHKWLSGRSLMIPPSVNADPFADTPADSEEEDDDTETPEPRRKAGKR